MSLESTDEPTPGRSGDEERHGQRRRLLDDPLSIRALAHPLRLELQSIVGRSGKITAADAARELGISHALASHHLRQLAKYGFVEQVEGADARERPWRVVHTSYNAQGIEEQAGGAAALSVLEQVTAERAVEDLIDWHERRADWSEDWRRHTGVGRSTLYLTEPELAELTDAIDALVTDYAEQRPLDDIASRPEGSVPIEFTLIVVPRKPTTGGN
jgi:DNA-binding transcriptional ArsR family regulator